MFLNDIQYSKAFTIILCMILLISQTILSIVNCIKYHNDPKFLDR